MQRLEMVVRPLEEVHAHFVRQEDQLQQAASLGQMLVNPSRPHPVCLWARKRNVCHLTRFACCLLLSPLSV